MPRKKENVYLYNRTLEEMDGEKKSYDMWAIRALSKSDSMVGPVKDLSCWLSSLDQMMWSYVATKVVSILHLVGLVGDRIGWKKYLGCIYMA